MHDGFELVVTSVRQGRLGLAALAAPLPRLRPLGLRRPLRSSGGSRRQWQCGHPASRRARPSLANHFRIEPRVPQTSRPPPPPLPPQGPAPCASATAFRAAPSAPSGGARAPRRRRRRRTSPPRRCWSARRRTARWRRRCRCPVRDLRQSTSAPGRGRVCHQVPISTERAQRCIRS
jgi:hypothetical protein